MAAREQPQVPVQPTGIAYEQDTNNRTLAAQIIADSGADYLEELSGRIEAYEDVEPARLQRMAYLAEVIRGVPLFQDWQFAPSNPFSYGFNNAYALLLADNRLLMVVSETDIDDLDHYTSADFATDFSSSNLANLGTKNHSDLTDDEATKHRIINDAGTSATELWSASKISTELAGKASSGHTHTHSSLTDDEAAKHRLINDSSTSSTELWSASKINSAINSIHNDVQNVWKFDSSISETAPGGGSFRLNHGTASSVTAIIIDDNSIIADTGADLTDVIGTIKRGDVIWIEQVDDKTNTLVYRCTGDTSIVGSVNFAIKVPVEHLYGSTVPDANSYNSFMFFSGHKDATQSRIFYIDSPTATEDYPIMWLPVDVTFTALKAWTDAGTMDFILKYGTAPFTGSLTNINNSFQATTSGGGTVTWNDATVAGSNWVRFVSSAVSSATKAVLYAEWTND